jgi:hypothetical protein
MKTVRTLIWLGVLFFSPLASAQSVPSSDAEAVWKALWSPVTDPAKSARAENVVIQRDRVKITLTDGTIHFAQPANGVTFAAVFHGNGRLEAEPPNAIEGHQLRLFTKQDRLDMPFTDATFSFTDGFLDEVARQVHWSNPAAADDLYAKRQQERENLGAAHVPRLFKGVLSGERKRTAFFLADLKTKDKGWVEVLDDAMEQEEISVGRWGDMGVVRIFDVWMSFPANGANSRLAYADPAARADYTIPAYKIDAAVTGGAELSATARVNVQPRYAGERVLLFFLDSNLRVDSVKDDKGQPLEFYQARETKDRYQSYGDYVAVVLSQPTQPGALQPVEFHYAGKRVVRKVGDGNYFCESFGWYPAMFEARTGTGNFAFRSDFEINFRSPKKYSLVATGHKLSATTDGDWQVTSWKSDIPLSVAGFAFGDYKFYSEKVGDIDIQVYANRQPDDLLRSIQRVFDNPIEELAGGPGGSPAGTGALGNLTPAALAKTIGIETANTIRVFQNYYGPYPYKQLAVTNIIGSYGQGWPGLLYLSWITFLDSTQRNTLGIRSHTELTDFFRAHESSHQWWGHRVSWKSYHDQWLSEGFAEFSGNLYVQYRQNMKESLTQWRKEKENLRQRDINGHAVNFLGPIWLGRRIFSSETNPSSYQYLIYSKGGYVLHMLRMMLYDLRNPDPDHLFKDMMQDFCKTFENKPASTEDFKAIVEKHMTRGMDLDSNHKMDWFFDQYVYGVGIPQYQFSYSTQAQGDGKMKFSGKLVRTGVPDNWKDAIPLYAHQGQGIMRVGLINAVQPETTFEVIVPANLDRFSINDYEDLLAEVKQ